MTKPADLFTQLAQTVGVSPSTVTLALQDSPKISPETKERVYWVSRRLGYRASKRKGNGQLNFLLFSSQSHPRQSLSESLDVQIWEGVSARAAQRNVSLFLHGVPQFTSRKMQFSDLPALLRRDQVDGALLMSVANESLIQFLQRAHIPAVLIGNVPVSSPIDQVRLDSEDGIRRLILALAEHGHERIGFVSAASTLPVHREYLAGYKKTMRELGRLAPRLIRTERAAEADGFAMSRDLLDVKPPPTVVFATNIRLAYDLAITAASRGMAFDCGFELATGHTDLSRRLGYPLHLLRPSLHQVGERAFDRLWELRENPNQAPCRLQIGCTITLGLGGKRD